MKKAILFWILFFAFVTTAVVAKLNGAVPVAIGAGFVSAFMLGLVLADNVFVIKTVQFLVIKIMLPVTQAHEKKSQGAKKKIRKKQN